MHFEDLNNDLYVLGEYRVDILGRSVRIYYGSFSHLYWYLDRDEMKEKVKETLYHELTHHLEHLANIIDLEIEDKIFIENYKDSYT